jgi:hypothetical protein
MKDYYKILMVHPEADTEIIKAAYRRLAQLYHPDVYKKDDAEPRMKVINEAYQVLGDPDRREAYDIERKLQEGGPELRRPEYEIPRPPWKYAGLARVIVLSFFISLLGGFLLSQGLKIHRQKLPVTDDDFKEAQKFVLDGDQAALGNRVALKPRLLKVKDRDGKTLLRHAVENGNLVMAKYIINRGVYVDDGTKSGYTPLHAAAYQGYLDMAQLLVTAGASVNARTNRGHTPLHLAASRGNIGMVEFLISRKADVNSPDLEGATPRALAEKYGKKEAVELLKVYGGR